MLTIKQATVENVVLVTTLLSQLWQGHNFDELKEEMRAGLASEESATFVAYDWEDAVGIAQCSLRHDYVEGTESSPIGYLEGIFVEECFREQGVAKKLCEACQEWAKQKGCVEFASDCELSNTTSFNFHLKIGFTEANRIICFTKKL